MGQVSVKEYIRKIEDETRARKMAQSLEARAGGQDGREENGRGGEDGEDDGARSIRKMNSDTSRRIDDQQISTMNDLSGQNPELGRTEGGQNPHRGTVGANEKEVLWVPGIRMGGTEEEKEYKRDDLTHLEQSGQIIPLEKD